jgi:hypothetical protein
VDDVPEVAEIAGIKAMPSKFFQTVKKLMISTYNLINDPIKVC